MIPPWAAHHHENRESSDAILYSITDEPVIRALGTYRVENDPD